MVVPFLSKTVEAQPPPQMQPDKPIRVPQYRRDLLPTNLVLSAEDLKEFCELLAEANERAKELEYGKLDLSTFQSSKLAWQHVNEMMPIEYNYAAQNGDSMQGLSIPNTNERTFPDDLQFIFVSNATFAQRAANQRPLNTVEALLQFEKPSLKLDLRTSPSNPTENRSVINVGGRDEDWVISTAQKIEKFFKSGRPCARLFTGQAPTTTLSISYSFPLSSGCSIDKDQASPIGLVINRCS